MRVGSLFSGVGGFDMGLEAAGMTVAWQVEIDGQCRAVLRRHWPNAKLYEDVSDVGGDPVRPNTDNERQELELTEAGRPLPPISSGGTPADDRMDGGSRGTDRTTLAPVDLICGGFPCQDLSVAGRREGLAGERSGLFYEFMRIVDELAPRWVLIENVPGLLSSNDGRDMGAVLGTLAELGYGYAYRVLDLQHFGVPQRRRRVFIVGHSGGVCPPEVLFEPESLPWDTAPGEEAGEVAPTLFGSGAGASRPSGTPSEAEYLAIQGRPAVYRNHRHGEYEKADAVETLSTQGRGVYENNMVAHTIRAEGFDASEDGTGRGTPLVPQKPRVFCNTAGDTALGMSKPGVPPLTSRHGDPGNVFGSDIAIPRRLTPTECERLMGWPDGHTAWGLDEDGERVEMADGPRYRMCGNGVGAPVAEWIGRRIVEADAALREADDAA